MTSTETGRCPYPFAWPENQLGQPDELLSAHREPLLRVRLPSGDEALVATRYDDIRAILADPRVSKNRNRAGVARMTERKEKVFQRQVDMDPPAHTRMRRLIAKTFSAARIEKIRPRVTGFVTELLDAMAAGPQPVDLNTAFSFPLSIRIICELLGVPEAEREQFGDTSKPPWGYMAELIERKRAEPGDDLISDLINVTDERDGRLSPEELHWWCTLLLLAGYETTANQLSGAVVLLCSHPEQLALLRKDYTLMPRAVEELMRCQVVGTSLSMLRFVVEDITVAGRTIPRGSSIIPSLECANHDPEVFAEPAKLDITRTGPTQLTFSTGQHFCAGAALARIELQIGIEGLLRRFPDLRLDRPAEALDRVQDTFFQGFRSVPVRW